jgi:hypothetical protein
VGILDFRLALRSGRYNAAPPFFLSHDEDTPVFKTSFVHGNIFGTWNQGHPPRADAARIHDIGKGSRHS